MDAILLAAGNSTRFGENKLLYEVEGVPMYRHALELLYQTYKAGLLDHIIVVTQYVEIMQQIEKTFPEITVKENAFPEKGISFSVRIGLETLTEIAPKSESCLFMVSDQPFFRLETLKRLILVWEKGSRKIAVCGNGERIGNPVVFGSSYYNELRILSGDVGGKIIVKRHMEDVDVCEADEIELEDVDVKSMFA